MEKNERLAWRTKPRTHIAGAFPAAQSAIAMADPSNCKFQKTTFHSLKSCFFIFPSRHPWEQAVSFSGAFPAAQSAIAMGNCKFQKTTFHSLKSCFFDFPVQTPLRAGSELFRCFSSCPKRNCNGRPFQLKISLIFPSRHPESRQWAFQVLFQLPKAQLQWETLPTENFKKQLFTAWKVVFLIFPARHPWKQAVNFSGAFPAAQSAIAMGNCKFHFRLWFFWFSPPDTLESRQWAFQVLFQLPKAQLQWETANFKNNFSQPEKLFFDFTFQNHYPRSQKGSGKLCHRPTPGHMCEPAWSHKNRENSESSWNEAT